MKKYLFTLFIFCSLFGQMNSFGQGGVWTWMNGSNSSNQTPAYGIKGVPGPFNSPGALYESVQWQDRDGNLWIYGGLNNINLHGYSDLWKFNSYTNEWTWVFGKGIVDEPANWGVKGIADTSNTPGSRTFGAVTWVDTSGNLWLYGGSCIFTDTSGVQFGGIGSDLWVYDIQTNIWTWKNGFSFSNPSMNYVAPTINYPGSINESNCGWTDDSNYLWMYGGNIYLPIWGSGGSDALWKYDIVTDNWNLVKGTIFPNHSPVYGSKGVPGPGNTPGGRSVYAKWLDNQGNFWIFGGLRQFSSWNFEYADMWKYNSGTNEWSWESGSDIPFDNGNYGSFCTSSTTYFPRSRMENRSCWKDKFNNFWMFGGYTYVGGNYNSLGDLWSYNSGSNSWNLVSGNPFINVLPNYGTKGISSLSNFIGSRMGAVGWCDTTNTFWVFGGWYRTIGNNLLLNDVWNFNIDSACGVVIYPPVDFSSNNRSVCPGTCISFLNLSTNTFSYQWSFPGATPDTSTDVNPTNICYANPGSYDVQLIASNPNTSDTLLLTNYITVYPAPPPQSITQSGDTLFAIAGATSYQWYFNGNIINSATDYFYVASTSGDYNVVATDANGCEVEAAVFNVVADLQSTVDSGQLTIFPNPVEDKVIIQKLKVTSETAIEISIYNVIGEMMSAVCLPTAYCLLPTCSIDVSNLPPGLYYIEITSSGNIFSAKFMKE